MIETPPLMNIPPPVSDRADVAREERREESRTNERLESRRVVEEQAHQLTNERRTPTRPQAASWRASLENGGWSKTEASQMIAKLFPEMDPGLSVENDLESRKAPPPPTTETQRPTPQQIDRSNRPTATATTQAPRPTTGAQPGNQPSTGEQQQQGFKNSQQQASVYQQVTTTTTTPQGASTNLQKLMQGQVATPQPTSGPAVPTNTPQTATAVRQPSATPEPQQPAVPEAPTEGASSEFIPAKPTRATGQTTTAEEGPSATPTNPSGKLPGKTLLTTAQPAEESDVPAEAPGPSSGPRKEVRFIRHSAMKGDVPPEVREQNQTKAALFSSLTNGNVPAAPNATPVRYKDTMAEIRRNQPDSSGEGQDRSVEGVDRRVLAVQSRRERNFA